MTSQSASSFISEHSKTCSAFAWFLCLLLSVSSMARANARAFLPTVRTSVSFGGINQENTNARPLESNKPIERELKVGESHWYRISLAADQYLYVVVEQCGINVVVALFESDNKKLSEVDTARGKQGSEFLTFIADLLGNYRLEISPAEKNVPAGRYQVQIVALRQPTPDERALEDAQSVRGVA